MPGQSLPGRVRLRPGGAARNVAVNLVRLGYAAMLLSAVGDDPLGGWLLRSTSEAGVDVGHVVARHESTGMYVTVGAAGGESWSVADAGPLETVTSEDLEAWRPAITLGSLVVSDANLPGPMQGPLASLAGATPRVLLATSPQKAVRLRPVLTGAAALVCNRDEARALTGLPSTLSWQALGTALLTEGVQRVVLTLGPEGVAVLTADEAVRAPALDVPIVHPAGAGDGVAAIVAHACLSGLDPEKTAALAAAGAAVVIQSEENTPAALAAVMRS